MNIQEKLEKWAEKIENYDEVLAYKQEAAKKSDFERTELAKDKTGVMLKGIKAINPVNGKEIPIFISDYVLISYGTGAIMAVPAHDTRDWDFAKKFGLPIIEVVAGGNVEQEAIQVLWLTLIFLTAFLLKMQRLKCKSGCQKKGSAAVRLIISCVTGYFRVKGIGVNLYLWYIAKSAVMCRCPKANCRLSCLMLILMNLPTTVNRL